MATMWDPTRLTAMGRLTASGGPLNGKFVALYTNAVNVTPTTPIEAFEFTTAAGLAPVGPLVWSAPFRAPNGQAVVEAELPPWVSAVSGPLVIYGWAITNEERDNWDVAEALEEPITITQIGDGAPITVRVAWGD